MILSKMQMIFITKETVYLLCFMYFENLYVDKNFNGALDCWEQRKKSVLQYAQYAHLSLIKSALYMLMTNRFIIYNCTKHLIMNPAFRKLEFIYVKLECCSEF